MENIKYRVIIFGNDDDSFEASCPALPECTSEGQTKEEALDNICDQIYLHIVSLLGKCPLFLKRIESAIHLEDHNLDLLNEKANPLEVNEDLKKLIKLAASGTLRTTYTSDDLSTIVIDISKLKLKYEMNNEPISSSEWFDRGWAEIDLDAKITAYSEAIRINPLSSKSYNYLGNALYLKGKVDEAIECYGLAIAFEPNWPYPYNNRGIIQSRQEQWVGAIRDYCIAITLNPQYTDCYVNRSVALAQVGLVDEAIIDLENAISINPDDANAHLALGHAYNIKNNYYELEYLDKMDEGESNARRAFEKARALGQPQAQECLDKLDKAEDD